MKIKGLILQGIVKNVLITLLLWFFLKNAVYDALRVTTADNIKNLGFILTACGLLIAGAISGFFSFSYKDLIKKDNWSYLHLMLGHIVTSLQILVIGVLLLAVVKCLDIYPVTSEMENKPLIVLASLYLSLVFYDLFDLLKLSD